MSAAVDKGTYAEDFDVAFQQHTLAVLLRVPGVALRYRTALHPEFFSADTHRAVAAPFFKLVDEHHVLPSRATLFEAVKVDLAADARKPVAELLDVLYADDITDSPMVVANLVRFGQQQAAVNAVLEAAVQLDRGDRTGVRALIEKAMMVGVDILDIGVRALDLLKEGAWESLYATVSSSRIPTGLPHLDLAMEGGLGRGELGLVQSFAKFGKSRLLHNFSFGGLVAGYNAAVYTFELNREHVLVRMGARLAGPNIKLLHSDPEQYFAMLRERQQKFWSGQLVVQGWPTRTCTVSMVEQNLRLLQSQGFKPDVAMFDYAALMKPESRTDGSTWEAGAGVLEDLRKLAGMWDMAVWTVAQSQRGEKDEEVVRGKGIRGAYEQIDIVDAHITASQTAEEAMNQRFRMTLENMRNVASGAVVECVVDGPQNMVKSIALYNAALERVDDIQTDIPGVKPGVSPLSNTAKVNVNGTHAGGNGLQQSRRIIGVRKALPTKQVPPAVVAKKIIGRRVVC